MPLYIQQANDINCRWMDGWTNGRTDGRTDGWTDLPSYRDAWTHLITHDTCQSILSCLNPTFRDKNFFPRRALGVLWAPPGSPLGIFPKSTPSDSLQMQHVSQEKYIILVSFQNWHSQNSLNPRHILFLQKNGSGWYFRAPPGGPWGFF